MRIEHYENFFSTSPDSANQNWQKDLYQRVKNILENPSHGDFRTWAGAVAQIAELPTTYFQFDRSDIRVGLATEADKGQQTRLENSLRTLIPWRKGPFNIFGIEIDTEWRSDLKWNRLEPHLPSLKNKRVLDVGCGNGYYMLRLLGAGAEQVIGVDPSLLFLAQFTAITQNITPAINACILPLPFEQLPYELNKFDCVLSLGVLYHRRDPLQHVQHLFERVVPGGAVILETLIVPPEFGQELIPQNRYAGMRNVWTVPSPELVETWFDKAGFENCTLLNTHATTIAEQRTTHWMPYHSLSEWLDPADACKTIEGYPAPNRAIFRAYKPAA